MWNKSNLNRHHSPSRHSQHPKPVLCCLKTQKWSPVIHHKYHITHKLYISNHTHRSQIMKWATFSSYCRQRTEPVWPVRTLWCCCRVWNLVVKMSFSCGRWWLRFNVWEVRTISYPAACVSYIMSRYLSVPHLDGIVPQARDYLSVVILKAVDSFEN